SAKWWTQGETPGSAQVWALVAACDGDGTDPGGPGDGAAAWSAGAVYVAGDLVTYQGSTYKAKWWTQGDTPGASEWGPWAEQ
ncbi:glycoside hydrolase, partial [Schumannella luteola]